MRILSATLLPVLGETWPCHSPVCVLGVWVYCAYSVLSWGLNVTQADLELDIYQMLVLTF